ncbi:SurA N-terminal domain-containing protein [Pseudomonas sp. GB2N2]
MTFKTLLMLLMLVILWLPVAFASNGPAAARVNGQEISEFRLERYFAEYLDDQGRALGSIRNPKAYKQLRQQALDALIDRELLWQEAVKRGVVISDATVQSQVDQTRQAIGGAEPFARRLNDAGFDEAGFIEYTRRELAAQEVFAELTKVDGPDEKQVRAFYEEHRAERSRPEDVQVRHILIKLPRDADAATVEAARLRLVEMRVKISHGALTGPVRTPLGWHLIYLQNHREATDVTELQGLESVRVYLARQQQVQVRRQVLAQLRSNNRIERIDDE